MEFKSAALRRLFATDRSAIEEALDALGAERTGFQPQSFQSEAAGGGAGPANLDFRAEGIVLRKVRPPLVVRHGQIVPPASLLTQNEAMVQRVTEGETADHVRRAIRLCGAVALVNVPGLSHLGTGWVVRRDSETAATIVTNRHVAEFFARADNSGRYPMHLLPNYDRMRVSLDLLREHGNDAAQATEVRRVLYIAPPRAADIALLRIDAPWVSGLGLGIGETLEADRTRDDAMLGVVGYPAYDPAADAEAQTEYFEGIYERKRFGWGRASGVGTAPDFNHDATTLGGSSGSMVFDLDSGKLVGLHYGWLSPGGGQGLGGINYAVHAAEVIEALRGLEPTRVRVGLLVATEAVSRPGRFRGRDGYRADFLGPVVRPPVPSPTLPSHRLAQAVSDDDGSATPELRYRHYSVWMSEQRLLPLMTAVNIDGSRARKMGRGDWWFVDHRLPADRQIDNRGYKDNPLDRGHMVRREDPVWGDTDDEAREANLDTFSFCNAAPQHEALNQKHWLALEDYVLGHARTRGLKVSVFTGPVFDDQADPVYTRPDEDNPDDPGPEFRIPLAFWKIAAVIDDDTGALSVTGYLVSQGTLIRDMLREFAYGGFMTYQVPLREMAAVTGLDLSHLIPHDPLERERQRTETVARSILGPADIVL